MAKSFARNKKTKRENVFFSGRVDWYLSQGIAKMCPVIKYLLNVQSLGWSREHALQDAPSVQLGHTSRHFTEKKFQVWTSVWRNITF